ncbi:MAG TPA: hypothetical protein VH250_02505 [Granulicella sp.]|jgi:hypothetical protein|nr:hypothetical protein [Granulicella sp.]
MRYQTHIPQIGALTLACLVLLSGWLAARAMNHAAIDDVRCFGSSKNMLWRST